ncbi:hypothetical protein VB776_05740 [Arcicella sp. DC2W]|uniref:Uncharacterized protein n=1 Tax=Arcicella gelida TaxID=2984195 RepID=A0ABU5S1U6_9BACT|nr:hypothetical protein [Arcicella sp. DC2W]MEA5402405.1 hypothetical protein [Arcicella sp. DC2W]
MMSETIFPTYNARHYAPREVAESFIISKSFEKLVQNNHSVILGARGCGKTTLMKMLTLPALNSWKGQKAETIKNTIPFYAIYISTDIYWDVKNQTYKSQLQKYGDLSLLISRFSVNTNVFTSLCDTFIDILEYESVDLNDEKEIELCKELISAWKLKSVIPKLKFIKEALNRRIDEVNQLIQDIIFNFGEDSRLPYPEYFNLSFETSIELLIPIFERIFEIENKKKWALCFDELEFAPLWLQTQLFKSLRSRKQYILYKLSSSPILSLELDQSLIDDYRATSGNDYDLIKMWNLSDNEFSIKIIESLLKKKYPLADVNSYFGSNEIYNGESNSYKKGSKFYKEMIELLKKDDSFKMFLSEKNVNILNPIPINDNQKNTLYRKIKPIVYYRNAFIEENRLIKGKANKPSFRSRKSANELLSGIEVLSKICDGNPRWLIGITNSILVNSDEKEAKRTTQYKELLSAGQRFKNVIGNIPIGNNEHSIIDIVNKIASYFKDQLLGSHFKMDPYGTFIVDKNSSLIPDNIIELLDKGISQGAFILLDTDDGGFDFEIRERRFKLSYLFFVLYNLPLRVYGKVSLSVCLKYKESANEKSSTQISLF